MAPSFKGTFKVCKRYPNTDCIEQAKQSLLKNDTFFSEKQRVSYIFDFYFSFLKADSIECCRGNVSGSISVDRVPPCSARVIPAGSFAQLQNQVSLSSELGRSFTSSGGSSAHFPLQGMKTQ